jgi:adenylate cyclase
MRAGNPSRQTFRFGSFVVKLRAGEVYRDGAQVRLQEQPFKILAILLAHPGEVVTRDELRETLWPQNQYGDFDHGINVAIAKIREALGDSSEEPQFVETVGRRGYRFIPAIEPVLERTSPSSYAVSTVPSLRPTQNHLVGREKERAELAAAFESAAGGRGILVCIAGEPGIGKTTLVQDFLSGLQISGKSFGLAIGRCSQRLAGEEAYLPLLEALDSLLRIDNGIEKQLREFAPTWYAQLLPLSESDPSDVRLKEYVNSATQERLKREFGAFIHRVTVQNPLVLFFDDVHWADPSTVDLLSYLGTKFESTRILVIVTYRPSELLRLKHPLRELKRDLQVHNLCREIEVEFLAAGDVERYIELEFPQNCFPREFSDAIHVRTEGSPLFMVDLLRYLRDRKVIMKTDDDMRWHLAGSIPNLGQDIPQSISSVIERKIEQLSDREREVLATAAIQGYEFDSATLARGLQADSAEIEAQLERLDRINDFVKRIGEHEFPNGGLTVRCRFIHVLYQNALYATVTPTRRVLVSGLLARALEEFYGEKSPAFALQLGFLYETARDSSRAADYFRLAAAHAAQIFAYHEAVALAQRGLALLRNIPDTPRRTRTEFDLQVTLALALQITRGYWAQETGATITKARLLYQGLGHPHELSQVLFSVWLHYIGAPELQNARQTAEQFLAIAQAAKDPGLLVMAHGILGVTMQHQGELVGAYQHFEEALRHHDPTNYKHYLELYRFEPGIYVRSESVRTLWMLGYPDQARRRSEETLALASTIPSPPASAFIRLLTAILCQFLRQPEEARQIAEECILLCDQHGVATERGQVMFQYGWAIAELGQVEKGISMIRAALDAEHAAGGEINHPQKIACLAEIHCRTANAEEGLKAIEDGLMFSVRTGNSHHDAELWRLRGEFLKIQDKVSESDACFNKAIEIAQQQSAKSLELRASTSLARLWQKQGKHQEAKQLLGNIYAWFTEGFDTADLREAASLLQKLS